MTLVEQHCIKKTSPEFAVLDDICHKSKNLYNATMYAIRQYYFANKKYLPYKKVNKQFKEDDNPDYRALPAKVAQQTQQMVHWAWKSFFEHLKVAEKGEKIGLPGYLDKDGRHVTLYTNQAVSFKNSNVSDGYLKLSGTDVLIKTDVDNVQFVMLVPKGNHIIVSVGYEAPDVEPICNDNYAAIDLGVNNLAALIFTNNTPILINGKPLKSINQYYNKAKAALRAHENKNAKGKKNRQTNKMKQISRIRNNKINDYLHKASNYVVNQLVSNNIATLVVGYNKGWKQDTNLGKQNNQNFCSIPFKKFVDMLTYKCALQGITVVTQEEKYTSKCSFLDAEPIQKHDKYCGRRVKRGLFRSQDGTLINADVNGAYNILRKHLQVAGNADVYSLVDFVEVCSTPSVFTVKS